MADDEDDKPQLQIKQGFAVELPTELTPHSANCIVASIAASMFPGYVFLVYCAETDGGPTQSEYGADVQTNIPAHLVKDVVVPQIIEACDGMMARTKQGMN